VLTNAGERTNGLYRLDAMTGKLGECLFRDATGSMWNVILRFAPNGGLAGIDYRRQTRTVHWFDPNFRALQAYVDQSVPDAYNQMVDWSDDALTVLIHSWPMGDPGRILILDLKQHRLRPFATCNPQLDRRLLSPTRMVRSVAGDGTNLQTFLIVPKTASPENPCPLVVYFGFSPWEQSRTGYFGGAQWLAAHGIAVLRINDNLSLPTPAEGSEPRLYDLKSAARRRNEAVQALIRSGPFDPKHVGFIAYNSGAILALDALRDAPETYRCAAIVNGIFHRSSILIS